MRMLLFKAVGALKDCLSLFPMARYSGSRTLTSFWVQVKSVMVENIDKVLERGEKIELLVDKTDALQGDAFRFKKQSRRLKQAMWLKNAKLT
jgi:hypothetical protein